MITSNKPDVLFKDFMRELEHFIDGRVERPNDKIPNEKNRASLLESLKALLAEPAR